MISKMLSMLLWLCLLCPGATLFNGKERCKEKATGQCDYKERPPTTKEAVYVRDDSARWCKPKRLFVCDCTLPCYKRCRPGHTPVNDNSCVDIDECKNFPNPCGAHSICTNTVGSFTCRPKPPTSKTPAKPPTSKTLNPVEPTTEPMPTTTPSKVPTSLVEHTEKETETTSRLDAPGETIKQEESSADGIGFHAVWISILVLLLLLAVGCCGRVFYQKRHRPKEDVEQAVRDNDPWDEESPRLDDPRSGATPNIGKARRRQHSSCDEPAENMRPRKKTMATPNKSQLDGKKSTRSQLGGKKKTYPRGSSVKQRYAKSSL